MTSLENPTVSKNRISKYPLSSIVRIYGGWNNFLIAIGEAKPKPDWLLFEEAREFVSRLRLKTCSEWKLYCKSGNRPSYIPSNPHRVYNREWKGYDDWLGTGKIILDMYGRRYATCKQLLDNLKNLGQTLGRTPQCKDLCKEFSPYGYTLYRNRFGTMVKALQLAGFVSVLPFIEARDFVRQLKLKNVKEWRHYCKSGNKTSYIPSWPNENKTYSKEWISWGDWLGTGREKKAFIPFKEARALVRKLKLKNVKEWYVYCKSDKQPYYIPSNPDKTYSKDWTGFGDWLGCDIRPKRRPTRKQLFDKLITLSQTLGRNPKFSDLLHKTPSYLCYKNEFGSWRNALKAAGFNVYEKASKEQLINNLHDIEKKLGRQPLLKDLSLHKGTTKYGFCQYQSVFGKWSNAIKVAGYIPYPLSDKHKKSLSEANKGRPSPRKGKSLSEEHKKKLVIAWERRRFENNRAS